MKKNLIKVVCVCAFLAMLFNSCKTPCNCGLGQVEADKATVEVSYFAKMAQIKLEEKHKIKKLSKPIAQKQKKSF